MTPFPLRMAWRETRAAWRHFLFFFLCIALGVGALVGVSLFAVILEQTVTREARSLLGGDLEIRLSRPMSEKGEATLDSLANRGIAMTHATELVAMAAAVGQQPARKTQLVELKAVEASYPLYGELRLDPPSSLGDHLHRDSGTCRGDSGNALTRALGSEGATQSGPCYGAVVQQSLLITVGLSLGDQVKIGQATFTITGLLRKEPDRMANAFSLGPRVMISREGLAAAELVKPGSRVRERYLLHLPPTVKPKALSMELRGRLAVDAPRITTYRSGQPRVKRFLDQLSRYLGLIGLTVLFVGGIGVATTVQAFIREKLETIAVLKTLGAESQTILRTYLAQGILLGIMGSAAGALLGVGLQGILPPLLQGLLSVPLLDEIDFRSALTWAAVPPVVKGVALGLLTTLLFTLWPLLRIRDVRPALILRREALTSLGSPMSDDGSQPPVWRRLVGSTDRVRLATAVVISLGLAGLAVWQAESWSIGLFFILGLVVAVALLLLAAWLLLRFIPRLPPFRSLMLRHAVRNLYRPGSQAAGVMVSVGIGVMVIVAVSLMERSLIREVSMSQPSDAPTFFFIDVQPDQLHGFGELVQRWTGGTPPVMTPLVRSRLHAVDGDPVVVDEGKEATRDRAKGRKRWYFTREYVLTFMEDLPKDNIVIKGKWWEPGERPSKPLVSVEEDAAKNLGLDIGSTIELDIQGATVSAEVSSIRKVDWGNFSTNFYMILSPGSLEGAPFTYVGTIRVAPDEEVPLQQAVVADFPNVTAINIGEVLDSFARILDRLSLAIRSIALLCILAGALVMAAALAATKYRRLYESVVLKALGATRGLIARSFATEYALLGFVAGVIGVLLASGLSWGVLYFFLDVEWAFQPQVLLTGLVLTILLALIVGFLSTFRLLGLPPLSVLRHE